MIFPYPVYNPYTALYNQEVERQENEKKDGKDET